MLFSYLTALRLVDAYGGQDVLELHLYVFADTIHIELLHASHGESGTTQL